MKSIFKDLLALYISIAITTENLHAYTLCVCIMYICNLIFYLLLFIIYWDFIYNLRKVLKKQKSNQKLMTLVAIEYSFNCFIFLSHTRWVFWHDIDIFDFHISNMLVFKEGENHVPTQKPILILIEFALKKNIWLLYL